MLTFDPSVDDPVVLAVPGFPEDEPQAGVVANRRMLTRTSPDTPLRMTFWPSSVAVTPGSNATTGVSWPLTRLNWAVKMLSNPYHAPTSITVHGRFKLHR